MFKRKLSKLARSWDAERPETFEFKKEDYPNMDYLPYDYRNDNDYNHIYSRLDNALRNENNRFDNPNLYVYNFIRQNKLMLIPKFIMTPWFGTIGPRQAPIPKPNNAFCYISPSYIIWENDWSYFNFYGHPMYMELPKHELRETTGYIRPTNREVRSYSSRLPLKWQSVSLSHMAGWNDGNG